MDEATLTNEFGKYVTDEKDIAPNLRRRNNFSALTSNAIGYHVLEFGADPQVVFKTHPFK
jgi:hypothetical protein